MQRIYGAVTDLRSLTRTERADCEVPQEQFKRSFGKLVTSLVGPCVVLAAHNDQTHEGLLGHFSGISVDGGQKQPGADPKRYIGADAFNAALPLLGELGPAALTTVWLGGACLRDETGPYADTKLEREYAASRIISLESAWGGLMLDWNDDDCRIDVQLDCPSGIITVEPLIT